MSDREIQTGLRAIRHSGKAVEIVSELIESLPINDVYALMKFARYWRERSEKRYRLSREFVAVKFLSNEHLAELMLTTKVAHRLNSGSSDEIYSPYPDNPWQQYYKNNHRVDTDLAIEEANFRGIYAPCQRESKNPIARLKKLKKMMRDVSCLERRHRWEYWAKDLGFVCLNCGRKVTDEEIYSGIVD